MEINRYIVIGGGVIGLSTAYHLNELGYNNVVVIERDAITSGTTWHSNGLVWRLRPSEIDIQLLSQTHFLLSKHLLSYSDVETTGWINNGGLFLAHNQKRMQEYQRLHGVSKYFGIESSILDKNEVIELLHPLIDEKRSDLTGGLYSPNDGFVDPNMYCNALVKAAKIKVFDNCKLIAINTSNAIGIAQQRKINSVTVKIHDRIEEITTDIVVNSSGVWAPFIAKLAGIKNIPQETMEHSYVITESIDAVSPSRTPNIRDHDLSIAFRVSGKSFCIGGYESDPVIISDKVDGLQPYTLFDLNWDKFGIHVENSAKLMPIIGRTGIKETICGPESFTPDHKPLLGEDVNVRGFFYASGFNSFGISLSGGAGLQLAKWIISGSPDIDLSDYDIRRFNRDVINNKSWCRQRCHESYARNYGIIYHFNEPICARDQTYRDELYETLLKSGCVYQERNGIQCPDWFDLEEPKLTLEQYLKLDNTFEFNRNSRQWNAVKHECKSCHESAVVFNLSSMGKFSLSGEKALIVMDMLCPTDITSMNDNSTIVTYFLNSKAGIDAEIVLNKINDNEFYITCPHIGANHVLTQIRNYMFDNCIKNTEITDLTKDKGILSIQGLKSTQLLEKSLGICLDNFQNMTHKEIEITGNIKLRLIRFSQLSHIGWELHMNSKNDLKSIYSRIMSEKWATNAGFRSYESLKSEKGWLSWSQDLRRDDMLSEAGLQSYVCEHKLQNKPFIGSNAMKHKTQDKRYVLIELENKNAIIWGLEPIRYKSRVIGLVRKSFYSYKKDQILANGFIYNKLLGNESTGIPSNVQIEVLGKLFNAKVCDFTLN